VRSEPFGPLDPALYREIVRRTLAEDLGWGDVTTDTIVPREQRARGVLVVNDDAVLAGLDVAAEAFRQLDPAMAIHRHRAEGGRCHPGDAVAEVTGYATALLTAERTALNFVQRLAGIATLTRQFVDAAGDRMVVIDTRKTTPMLRTLEKYAVRAGGGTNHRMRLDDGIVIKANHIRLAGSVRAAVDQMRTARHEMPIEVEIERLDDLAPALEAGASMVLVDGLATDVLTEVVRRTRGRAKVQIIGSLTPDRVRQIAPLGAEYVSIGALTCAAPLVDMTFAVSPI
jgi:nicotinate-nucleotide pyrophosphorylase (carboxylating)